MTRITVVGLGFVGLTTALGFSEKGFKVFGYDIAHKYRSLLQKGSISFHEPGLQEALRRHGEDRFVIVDELDEAVLSSQFVFLCVGTPRSVDGSVDLTQLFTAIKQILKRISRNTYQVLVVKSTIPPGSTKDEILPFIEKNGFKVGADIGLATNPEFLREGCAWQDFIHPDRIVVGTTDEQSEKALKQLYSGFDAPLFGVSFNTAEFIKYLSNALLSTMISYANEMAMIADTVGGIDVSQSFKVLHRDKRWSGDPANMASYVYPGCGFGGYCLPKDTEAIYMHAKDKGYEAKMLHNVLDVNNRVKDFLVERVTRTTPTSSTVGILGLSFKPNSDDVRDTPARAIIERLLARGYDKIVAYDPMATEAFGERYDLPIRYAGSLTEIVNAASVFVLLTAWDEFKRNKALFGNRVIHDFRYCL